MLEIQGPGCRKLRVQRITVQQGSNWALGRTLPDPASTSAPTRLSAFSCRKMREGMLRFGSIITTEIRLLRACGTCGTVAGD